MLNILPAEQKNILEQQQWYWVLRQSAVIIIATILLVNGLIIGCQQLLQLWQRSLAQQTDTIILDDDTENRLKAKLDRLNNLIRGTKNIQTTQAEPVSIITALMPAIPDQVVISKLTIEMTDSSVTIIGTVRDRAMLSVVRQQLEQAAIDSDRLTEPNFVVTNLTSGDTIPFTFSASIL
ncbi:MAG: hypothetical protein HYV33_05450 [Candidatus Kerfeldbacteria bacterium]|nr:hypothetical protein [Candidatus Kerfeldbacteria bacterium]